MSNSTRLKDGLIGNYQYVTNVIIQFEINYRLETADGISKSLQASTIISSHYLD